jgi:hypothetical protein
MSDWGCDPSFPEDSVIRNESHAPQRKRQPALVAAFLIEVTGAQAFPADEGDPDSMGGSLKMRGRDPARKNILILHVASLVFHWQAVHLDLQKLQRKR